MFAILFMTTWICLAALTEIIVGTHAAFIANATNAGAVIFAGGTVAADVDVLEVRVRGSGQGGQVIIEWGELVAWMVFFGSVVTFSAEVVVAAAEAFVADTADGLGGQSCLFAKREILLCTYHRRHRV